MNSLDHRAKKTWQLTKCGNEEKRGVKNDYSFLV